MFWRPADALEGYDMVHCELCPWLAVFGAPHNQLVYRNALLHCQRLEKNNNSRAVDQILGYNAI
ncbi:hypothetical protein FOCC_FOCC015388 [Frankliniella occidentalis]|nr:hypothetical protein FOCC_FOCC015388 [Frankliniella occidentalis]